MRPREENKKRALTQVPYLLCEKPLCPRPSSTSLRSRISSLVRMSHWRMWDVRWFLKDKARWALHDTWVNKMLPPLKQAGVLFGFSGLPTDREEMLRTDKVRVETVKACPGRDGGGVQGEPCFKGRSQTCWMSHPGLFLPCDLCQERRSTEPRVSSPEARTGSRACGLRVRATKVMGSPR